MITLKKIKSKHHDSYCQGVEALIQQSRKYIIFRISRLPSIELAFVSALACSGRVYCSSLLGVLKYIIKLDFLKGFIALPVGSCLLHNSNVW